MGMFDTDYDDDDFREDEDDLLNTLFEAAGEQRLIECRDGQEPIDHDIRAISFEVCKSGHLHEIVFGDPEAVKSYLEQQMTERGMDAIPVAAQGIKGLDTEVVIDAIKADLGDTSGMPEVLAQHTTELLKISMEIAAGERPVEDAELHMLRAMVDPAFMEGLKEYSTNGDSNTERSELGEYETLLEAALDGKDVPGSFLVTGKGARPDLIERVMDELDGD